MTRYLTHYSYQINVPVAWGDMDSFQHVNSVAYFRYMESSRVSFFELTGLFGFFQANNVGCVVAAQSCQYLLSITYPDTLTIGVKANDISGEKLTLSYIMFSAAKQRVVAKASSKMVCLCLKTNEKISIPIEFSEKLHA